MGTSSPSSSQNFNQGIGLMVGAMLIAPGMDAIAKALAGSVGAGQVVFFRFLIQALILLPFVWRADGFRVGRLLWVHAARGVLVAVAVSMFFASLAELPLADALAIFFIEPFVLTILSAVLLRERVGWRRLLAVVIGFGGALIIIRPTYDVFGVYALLPLGTALFFALYMILSRWLVSGGSAVTMQFYAGVFGAITMGFGFWVGFETGLKALIPVWPSPFAWSLLVLIGVLATGTHMMIVLAIRRVGAGLVAPFQYVEIISGTILGVVFFGDFPDTTTWIGVSIIIASGLYVFIRERKLAFAAAETPPVP